MNHDRRHLDVCGGILHPGVTIMVWSIFVGLTLAGFIAGAYLGILGVALLAVPAVGTLMLVGLEAVRPDRATGTALRDPELANDLGHTVLSQVLGTGAGDAVVSAVAAIAAGLFARGILPSIWPDGWPLLAQGLLLVFLADGLDTIRHRALHVVPWLWPIHALHHSVDRLHVMKASRNHVLDFWTRSLAVYTPLVLAGAPPALLLWHPAAVTLFGPIAHANVRAQLPAWLHRVVMTPEFHRVHHARPLALSNRNYCNVFPLWDFLLRSFAPPERCGQFDYGMEDELLPNSFLKQVAAPFVAWACRAAR